MPWSAKPEPPPAWAIAPLNPAAFSAATAPAPSWAIDIQEGAAFSASDFDPDDFDAGYEFIADTPPAPSWGQGHSNSPNWTPRTPPPPSWATE